MRGKNSAALPKFTWWPAIAVHAATEEQVRRFEQEFGGRDCDQLPGCDIGAAEGQAKFEKEQLYFRCERDTVWAAEITASLLARNAG
jgi:hypothetical protein